MKARARFSALERRRTRFDDACGRQPARLSSGRHSKSFRLVSSPRVASRRLACRPPVRSNDARTRVTAASRRRPLQKCALARPQRRRGRPVSRIPSFDTRCDNFEANFSQLSASRIPHPPYSRTRFFTRAFLSRAAFRNTRNLLVLRFTKRSFVSVASTSAAVVSR